jgi:hypothetical protein
MDGAGWEVRIDNSFSVFLVFQMNGFFSLVLCTSPSSGGRKLRLANGLATIFPFWKPAVSKLLLSRLLDGQGLVVGDVPILVSWLISVFMERLHSLRREVRVALRHHSVDRLTILILHR